MKSDVFAGMSPVLEVFLQFLALGCSSFGGPVAHLGYFHERFVQRERWISDGAYADLVALCQMLPGPSSSQVGIGLGLLRAGWLGGLAAWLGFTLPSALLMMAAAGLIKAHPVWLEGGWVHGLKVAAVVVVAQAVLGLQRKLANDGQRASLMVASAVLVLLSRSAWAQLLALGMGALVGITLLPAPMLPAPDGEEMSHQLGSGSLSRVVAINLLGLLLALMLALPWLSGAFRPLLIQQLSAFLRAGTMVFGGGHVVLPLLEQSLVPMGWLGMDQFLAGYGLAQTVPGPMFSFAAFLGFGLRGGLHGIGGALLALLALFLPAFCLIGGLLPFWAHLGRLRAVRRALVGINASVVGILLAALFQPLWQVGIRGVADFSLALVSFLMLVCWKQPAWRVVLLCAVIGGVSLN